MKQIKNFMLPLFIMAVAFAVSCKKNNDDLNQQPDPVNVKEDYGPQEVTAPNGQYIEKQLRWIARGIPRLAKNNNPFRNEIENRLLNFTGNFFKESHTYFQGWFTTNLSLDYEQEVYDNVNLHFPGGANDYDRDYFETFDFGDHTWSVGLFAPELDIVDKNLLHVITVEPMDESVDESWGYYIDTTTLGLDSILLDDDNYNDYYVWVVYAQHPYEKRLKQSTETCDCGDGACEPTRCGEGWPDCSADCDDPSGNGKKTLMLIEYSLETDNKPYQESWLDGEYEIYFGYLIEGASSPFTLKVSTTDQVDVDTPVIRDDEEKIGILLDKIKRKEIRRCGNKCRGDNPPRISPQDYILYQKYDASNDNIVIVFYEYDSYVWPDNYISHTSGNHDLMVRTQSGIYNNNSPFIITPSTTGWTAHTHNSISGEMLEVVSSDGELKFKLFRYDN